MTRTPFRTEAQKAEAARLRRAHLRSERQGHADAVESAQLDMAFYRGERDAANLAADQIDEMLSGIRRVIGQSNLTEADRVYYRTLRNALTARIIAAQVSK